MKIGVYVGSFNPVHKGHIKVVNYLLSKNILDKVIIIPTLSYWDKLSLVSLNHRINMLKHFENDRIIIDTENNQFEYTYQILDNLKNKYKENQLYLIIGADLLSKFYLWKNVDKILENKVLVINRDNIEVESYINSFKNYDNFIIIKDFPKIDMSSTFIRNNLKQNKNNDDLDNLLDKRVLDYIKKEKLYI